MGHFKALAFEVDYQALSWPLKDDFNLQHQP